jgi:hypothetical protein
VSELVSDIWASVISSASLVEVANRLAQAGFDQMPSLAAFFWTPDGMQSLIRGTIVVTDPATGRRVADGDGAQTWREVGLGHLDLVVVRLEKGTGTADPALVLPLVVGVAQASSLILDARPGALLTSPQLLPGRESAPRVPPAAEETAPLNLADAPTEALPAPAADPPGAAASETLVDLPRPGAATNPGPAEAAELTQRTTPPRPPDPTTDDSATTAMIPAVVDADGRMAPPPAVIMGVTCPRGHSNPPDTRICRVCDLPVSPQPARPVPRPAVARIRTSDGSTIEVDRAVLVGRAPSEQRSTEALPRLLTVHSPTHDISRTHLQIAPDGWGLVAIDLRSTNGTVVLWPGGSQRDLLDPGRPTPIPIGTVFELGDGVTLAVERPG